MTEILFRNSKFLIIAWQHSGCVMHLTEHIEWIWFQLLESRMVDGPWFPNRYCISLSLLWACDVKCWNNTNRQKPLWAVDIDWMHLNKLSTYMTCLYHSMIPLNSITFDELSEQCFPNAIVFFQCNHKTPPIRSINEWPSLQPKICTTFKWMNRYIRFCYDYYRRWLHWTLDDHLYVANIFLMVFIHISTHVPFFPFHCKLKIHCRLKRMFVHWIKYIIHIWYKCTLHLIQKWLLLIQWIWQNA